MRKKRIKLGKIEDAEYIIVLELKPFLGIEAFGIHLEKTTKGIFGMQTEKIIPHYIDGTDKKAKKLFEEWVNALSLISI